MSQVVVGDVEERAVPMGDGRREHEARPVNALQHFVNPVPQVLGPRKFGFVHGVYDDGQKPELATRCVPAIPIDRTIMVLVS